MKIAGFIPNPEKAKAVVSWALSFAGEEDEIEFLCYEMWYGDSTQKAVKEALGENDLNISFVTFNNQLIVRSVAEYLRKGNFGLLVTSQFSLQDIDGIEQSSLTMINEAPCRTFISMSGDAMPEKIQKVLFFASGYLHDRSTLKLLSDLSKKLDWKITVASVEKESAAKAGQSSEQSIKSMIHDLGLDAEDFEIKVAVDRMILGGIKECYDDHDIIVAGMDSEKYFRIISKAFPQLSTAIVKRIPPLRLKSIVEWLPRINPSDHADLIHELRQGSTWGPDFIVMLGLAAAVSSLGLIQDSPAVVIGSMLLAPLMTPMMGLGLALAQANTKLMRRSLKTILLGFLLTVVISFSIGYIIPSGETLSQEVLSRGSPNVLDLMIALFAAAAAAYAMARPNIIGAIAGVAIATALVPPACSIGISLSKGAYLNGFGAALLFFANLVAIIAASSFIYQFLGISSSQSRKKYQRIAMLARVGLVMILLALFAPMSNSLINKINEGKNVAIAYPVTSAVSRAVNERINQENEIEVMYMARGRSEPGVIIHLASKNDLPYAIAEDLKLLVREEMNDPNIPVQVVAVRSIWIMDD